jgi:LacI family transcriptional regulator
MKRIRTPTRIVVGRQVTIKEIAKVAGVSPTAVSLVVNGKAGVSQETRERVLMIIEKLNYLPNAIAKSLARRKTKTIGLIISDITDPFYAEFSRGVEDVAFREGFSTILCNSDNQQEKEELYLGLLLENQVAGLILTPTSNTPGAKFLYAEKCLPLVIADRKINGSGILCVTSQNSEGAYEATKHLVELGHERIACICLPREWSTSVERVNGYRQALIDSSFEVDENLILFSNGRLDGGRSCTEKLLQMREPPTALFVTSDIVAFGAVEAITDSGLSVPGDISVVGFDNIEFAEYFRVPLTTVDQPKYEMGFSACRALLERIGGVSTKQTIELETRLIVRHSSGKRAV